MKEIPLVGELGTGLVALVDDEDYDLVAPYTWHVYIDRRRNGRTHGPYAQTQIKRNGKWRQLKMHKLITGYERTDHEDGNGLNNQRANLREASAIQNSRNRPGNLNATSRFKHVSLHRDGKWVVAVRGRYLGLYRSELAAACAADEAARETYGDFAYLNFPDPGKVMIAADWHRNERWATSAIGEGVALLCDEPVKLVIQLGDFGLWREQEIYHHGGKVYRARTYLDAVTIALEKEDAYLYMIDGNHEDHPYLRELAARGVREYGWITPRVRWLPRGCRWTWHGRTWLACGGAVSVDKNMRDEGIDWFPEEEITDEQEAAIIAGGPADVLLSHDAPSSEPLPLGVPPLEWLGMIPRAEAHRERLERICATLKVSHIFHGHYHMAKQGAVQADWGRYAYTALDMDGTRYNWGILDTETMGFMLPEEAPE